MEGLGVKVRVEDVGQIEGEISKSVVGIAVTVISIVCTLQKLKGYFSLVWLLQLHI